MNSSFICVYRKNKDKPRMMDGVDEDGINEDGINEDGINKDGINEHETIVAATDQGGSADRSDRRRLFLWVLVVGIATVVALVVFLTRDIWKNQEEDPPASPLDVPNLVDRLTSEYPELESDPLFEEGTPQNCAINWLALEDDWTKRAFADNVPIQRIGERYALTVIVYATAGGDCITYPSLFLPADCRLRYSEPEDEAVGVLCNADGFIVTLDLGEYIRTRRRLLHDHLVVLTCFVFLFKTTMAFLESYHRKYPFCRVWNVWLYLVTCQDLFHPRSVC